MLGTLDNELLIRCECGSHNHHALLVHEPDQDATVDRDDWYLTVMLDDFSFLKRVQTAFWYLVNPRSLRYGMYSELTLCGADVDGIANFIRKQRRPAPTAVAVANTTPTTLLNEESSKVA